MLTDAVDVVGVVVSFFVHEEHMGHNVMWYVAFQTRVRSHSIRPKTRPFLIFL